MKVYVCSICHEVNSAARLQCRTCGTIPAKYSIHKRTEVFKQSTSEYVETVNAPGCLRLEMTRTARVYLRTVPLDYYAN